MPEGPEVLEYYNFIKPLLNNKILTNIEILSGKYLKKSLNNLDIFRDKLPCKINRVLIKGKTIFICLDNDSSLVITHGMSGYWSDELEKHTRIKFELNTSKTLYYIDTRNFGTITICLSKDEFNFKENKLGPYILQDNITYKDFYSRLDTKPRSKISVALLDQNLISGIGNYLRCDILWYAKINGECRIKDLTLHQKKVLYETSVNLCRYYANMSFSLEFTPEHYNRDFFVYMQENDIYNNPILTKKINGRTFHYVEY
jgi:endonuclease-8